MKYAIALGLVSAAFAAGAIVYPFAAVFLIWGAVTSSRGDPFDEAVPNEGRTGPSDPAKVTLVFVDVDTLPIE